MSSHNLLRSSSMCESVLQQFNLTIYYLSNYIQQKYGSNYILQFDDEKQRIICLYIEHFNMCIHNDQIYTVNDLYNIFFSQKHCISIIHYPTYQLKVESFKYTKEIINDIMIKLLSVNVCNNVIKSEYIYLNINNISYITQFGIIDDITREIFTKGLCCQFMIKLSKICKIKVMKLIRYYKLIDSKMTICIENNDNHINTFEYTDHVFGILENGKYIDIEGIVEPHELIDEWTINNNDNNKLKYRIEEYDKNGYSSEYNLRKKFNNKSINNNEILNKYIDSIIEEFIVKYDLKKQCNVDK